MTRLKIENVTTHYGRTQILYDVSFPDIKAGTMVGLLGPNACGKSTLISCLSGIKKSFGHISFDGHGLQDVSHHAWFDMVATMPQTPPSPTALTPTELMWSTARALALPLSGRELASLIEDIFHNLNLAGFELKSLHSLSGGKRQLVGLAQALIRDPELLLLDEPTSALDLHGRMSVLKLVVDRVKGTGGVAVAALHDLDLAARYCDLLVLMDNGRVVATGTPGEVLTADNIANVYHVESEIDVSSHGHIRLDIIGPTNGIRLNG